METAKHEFFQCNSGLKQCGCLECQGILYCNVCGCIDDELLSHCPGFLLDGDAANDIADGKVIDLDSYVLKRYAMMMPLGFKNSGLQE